jgi:hypothetical protein
VDAPPIEEATGRGTQIALLALVVALAAATVGYVVHPAFRQAPAPASRACEVVLLESGSPDCVASPARAAAAKAKAANGAAQQPKRQPARSAPS